MSACNKCINKTGKISLSELIAFWSTRAYYCKIFCDNIIERSIECGFSDEVPDTLADIMRRWSEKYNGEKGDVQREFVEEVKSILRSSDN